MAKTTLRAKTRTTYLWAVGALLVLISVGFFYMYRQNNLGSTDSDAGSNPKLVLLSSSISDTSPDVSQGFTVKCNYQIPYSKETKRLDGVSAAKKTAEGIYVIGDNVNCTKNKLANESEPGNVEFTCKSSKAGIYAVGCGIQPGTQTVKLEKTTKQECAAVVTDDFKKVDNCVGKPNCVCSNLHKASNTWHKSQTPYGEYCQARAYAEVCKDLKTIIAPYPVNVDVLDSYKVIANVKVGNPTGSANCVVPVYMNGSAFPNTVTKKNDTEVKAPMFSYNTRCVYAIKGAYSTSSVKVTADKATSCATTTNNSSVAGYTISNPDFMYSKCSIKTGTAIGSKVTTSCGFVAGTVNDVKICGRTDVLKDKVTIVD